MKTVKSVLRWAVLTPVVMVAHFFTGTDVVMTSKDILARRKTHGLDDYQSIERV